MTTPLRPALPAPPVLPAPSARTLASLLVHAALLGLPLAGCAGAAPEDEKSDACAGPGALLGCSAPTMPPEHYVAQAELYFDTMDARVPLGAFPDYTERVARWEWPPWLKLTGWTREGIEISDRLLRAYPSIVDERDCRFFDEQPFARCRVVFYYDAHDGQGCPIYEEFAFNEAGQMSWIEAWSDQPGLLPMDAAADRWAEGADVSRLASRVPGLGDPSGDVDPDSEAMERAAAADADVADFQARARDFGTSWAAEAELAGDDLWARGCGW